MTPEQNATLNTITGALGVKSLAALALYTPAEIFRRVRDTKQDCSWSALEELHAEATKEYDDLRILEKSILIRASPLLPGAIRLGLKHPDISLQDYEEWFGGRATQYARPGEVASVFSPAAYLTDLYREARTLYSRGNRYNIDVRRPDLKNLRLSQKNMDAELSSLAISNEILFEHARDQFVKQAILVSDATDDDVLNALSEHLHSSGTPYHHHYGRLRRTRMQHDPDFSQLQQAPAVTKGLSGPALAAMYYDIPPALYELLTDEITAANAEEKYSTYFGEIPPEAMLDPQMFRRWYGLTDEEVRLFIQNGDLDGGSGYINHGNGQFRLTYSIDTLRYHYTTWPVSKVYHLQSVATYFPVSDSRWRAVITPTVDCPKGLLVQLWGNINTGYKNESYYFLYPEAVNANETAIFEMDIQVSSKGVLNAFPVGDSFGSWIYASDTDDPELIHTNEKITLLSSAHVWVLTLNKMVRLYKATGLSPRVLEDIVNSVNSADPDQITDETLTLLSRTALLMQRYGISHEDAMVMARGFISQSAHSGEQNQWDRLFNSPSLAEDGFYPSETTLGLDPDTFQDESEGAIKNAQLRATLKRACQTDDAGLYKLFQCYGASGASTITLNLSDVSALYTLSLWMRQHELTPDELSALLKLMGYAELSTFPAGTWQTILERLHSEVSWFRGRGWTVHDLHIMTRDVTAIPVSTEITNFIQQVKEFIVSSELPNGASDEDRIVRLAPLIAAVFSLNSDTAAAALLYWSNAAKPGGTGLTDFWLALTDAQQEANVTAFAYSLAQMALIYHATGGVPDALMLFVKTPAVLGADTDEDGVLPRSLTVVRQLSEFSQWLSTLNDAEGEIIAALSAGGIDAARLGRAASLNLVTVKQAMACAGLDNNKAVSFADVQRVLQWCGLAASFNVMPETIGLLLKMDYKREKEVWQSWDNWKKLADAFAAGLTRKQEINVEEGLGEDLSAALCGYLFSTDSNVVSFIDDREKLYQYLLADNLNGSQVKTTRLAEAISALQTFIHRTLSSPESPDSVVRAAPGRQFFLDWQEWNSRYSHWGAYRKLMYYPENYLDPTVRLGQTPMMDDMLQVLGQTQVNEDTVGDGFMGYLTSFEEVANLETLCGFHDNAEPRAGKTWFIGHNQNEVREYWWRTVDEGKRDANTGNLPANAWTSWEKISSAPQVWNNFLRPVVYKSRLYLVWIERTRGFEAGGDDARDIFRYQLKISGLRYDGGWNAPVSRDVTDAFEAFTDKTPGLYVSVWAPTDSILVLAYDQNNVGDNVKGWSIFDNMHVEEFNGTAATITMLKAAEQLQIGTSNPVINVFTGAEVVGGNQWDSQGNVPPEYSEFSLELLSVTPVTKEDDSSYSLTVDVRGTLHYAGTPALNAREKESLSILMNKYPEISSLESLDVYCYIYSTFTTPSNMFMVVHSGKFFFSLKDEAWYHKVDNIVKFKTGASNHFLAGELETFVIGEGSQRLQYSVAKYTANDGNEEITNSSGVHFSKGLWEGKDYDVIRADTKIIRGMNPNDNTEVTIPGANITVSLDDIKDEAETDYEESNGKWTGAFSNKLENVQINSWSGDSHRHKMIFSIKRIGKTFTREYQVKVYRSAAVPLRVEIVNSAGDVQALVHETHTTRLNTLFARQLTERASQGISTILNWDTQQIQEPPLAEVSLALTLPVYNASVHGADTSVVVYLNPGDMDKRITLWKGELSRDDKTQVSVSFPATATCATGGHYHLEIGYQKGINDAASGRSIMLSAEDLSVVRGPDADISPLSGDIVASVVVSSAAKDPVPMDFSGANGLYFWELFYYSPMMVMQRFLQEESFDKAEQWLQYIFNPAGYMEQLERTNRLWGVRPLQEDTGWNDEPLKSYDPDAVAQNDPMHYKLHVFMRLLDIVMGKGDAAYRKLERDTLAEAKVWYSIALNLLGEKPWIGSGNGWFNPTLGMASSTQNLTDRIDALSLMAQGIHRPEGIPLTAETGSVLFYPEASEVMLGYWETLHLRMYNLRHNLTLDGQPMSLPVYASPADPKALLAAAVAAEGGAGSELPTVTAIPALRFTPMLESARSMASQLIQFGSSMQQILLSQDAEALAELLATQGAEIADSSLTLQKQGLHELEAERVMLEKTLETASVRYQHYRSLYQENVNAREMQAMNLLTSSQTLSAGIKPLYVAGAVSGLAPNIFGLANGGMKYEGPLNAAGIGIEIAASALEIAGRRIEQEEQYRRRRQDWDVQQRSAEKEMAFIQVQLDALAVRRTSAVMQIAHMEAQRAHADAQLALFRSKFTGKAMYSWLRGRLATIFYQYYDLTASLCLMAQKSLQWEKGDSTAYLKTGTWSGAWAGLMSGEGLMLSLAQMEMAWMKHQKRELEVTRTVSLAAFFAGKLDDGNGVQAPLTLSEAVSALLKSGAGELGTGLNKVEIAENQGLAIHFSLNDLGLMADYPTRKGRIRSIAVSLPALLGPYQDVRARLHTNVAESQLPVGCNECAISRALLDNGLFAPDGTGDARWGARWLPFEGLDVSDESGMTLSFADATGDQKALLESLSDAIVHIQFTVR